MVLRDLAAAEERPARPGLEVAVQRPVQYAPVIAAVPVLVHAGGEGRVLYVEREAPAGPQRAVNALVYAPQVLHIVQREVRYAQVERALRPVEVLDGAAAVFYPRRGVELAGAGEHPFARVYAQHAPRPARGAVRAVPAVAAAEVEDVEPRHVLRQQPPELLPLPRRAEPAQGARHAGIAVEKRLVVVCRHIPASVPKPYSRAASLRLRLHSRRKASHPRRSKSSSGSVFGVHRA